MTIGMILDAPFPPDPRVENEAASLVQAGYQVCLFCLTYGDEPAEEIHEGIRICRYRSDKLEYKLSALAHTLPFYTNSMAKKIKKVVFSIHPRTLNNFNKFGLFEQLNTIENLTIIEPQNYFSFQKLIAHAFCVITDSGGIQEETSFLQVSCITLRENTERPSTIEEGTNTLMSFKTDEILEAIQEIFKGKLKTATIPKHWNGHATERIIKKSMEFLV